MQSARSVPTNSPKNVSADPPSLTPLVLLVDDQEWTSRSIESVLRPNGHMVLKAYTGRQAVDLVQKVKPDAIIVDFRLPDMDGIEVARELRRASTVSPVTPLLMISSSTVGRAERIEALSAGVWDILRHPFDPAELVLRMETLVRAKQEADRLREEGLTDPGTGFYNARGLLRRTQEISADAIRFARPLACVAFGPEWLDHEHGPPADDSEIVRRMAEGITEALKAVTRVSDTVGRLGTGEFVIVAPGTDRAGALRLADRVLELVEESREPVQEADVAAFRLRAGFHASHVPEPVDPEDLLFKATMALRRAQADDQGFPVRGYDA